MIIDMQQRVINIQYNAIVVVQGIGGWFVFDQYTVGWCYIDFLSDFCPI